MLTVCLQYFERVFKECVDRCIVAIIVIKYKKDKYAY